MFLSNMGNGLDTYDGFWTDGRTSVGGKLCYEVQPLPGLEALSVYEAHAVPDVDLEHLFDYYSDDYGFSGKAHDFRFENFDSGVDSSGNQT